MIVVSGPLKTWSNGEGRMHFMSVQADRWDEIRAHAVLVRRGFGSVRVEARIGSIVWRTSVFPMKGGGYFLPMKIDVCRKAGLTAGSPVELVLELL